MTNSAMQLRDKSSSKTYKSFTALNLQADCSRISGSSSGCGERESHDKSLASAQRIEIAPQYKLNPIAIALVLKCFVKVVGIDPELMYVMAVRETFSNSRRCYVDLMLLNDLIADLCCCYVGNSDNIGLCVGKENEIFSKNACQQSIGKLCSMEKLAINGLETFNPVGEDQNEVQKEFKEMNCEELFERGSNEIYNAQDTIFWQMLCSVVLAISGMFLVMGTLSSVIAKLVENYYVMKRFNPSKVFGFGKNVVGMLLMLTILLRIGIDCSNINTANLFPFKLLIIVIFGIFSKRVGQNSFTENRLVVKLKETVKANIWDNFSFGKSIITCLLMSCISVGGVNTSGSDKVDHGFVFGRPNQRKHRERKRRRNRLIMSIRNVYDRRNSVRERIYPVNLSNVSRNGYRERVNLRHEPETLAQNSSTEHQVYQIFIPTRLRPASLEILFANENILRLHTGDNVPRNLNSLVNGDEHSIRGFLFPECINIRDQITSIHRVTKELLRCSFGGNNKVFIREITVEAFNKEMILRWNRLKYHKHIARLYGIIRREKKMLILFESSDRIFNFQLPWNDDAIHNVLNQLLVVKDVIMNKVPRAELYASSIGCTESGSDMKLNLAGGSNSCNVPVSNSGIGTFLVSVLQRKSLRNTMTLVNGKSMTCIAIMLSSCTPNDTSEIVWMLPRLFCQDTCIEIIDARRNIDIMFRVCGLDTMEKVIHQINGILDRSNGANPRREVYEIIGVEGMRVGRDNTNEYVMKNRVFVTYS